MRRFSALGRLAVLWFGLCIASAIVQWSWQRQAIGGACILATVLVSLALRRLIGRERPGHSQAGRAASTKSMPSSHAATAVVGATVMSALQPSLFIAWSLLAALLAASRALIGLHFIGDVVAGAVLGALLSYFAVWPLLT